MCVLEEKQLILFRYIDELTRKSNVTNCSSHVYLPVLDFKPLVQPPAEKQRLRRNFLYVHTLEVYVDAGTFFAQEFCQTQKIKRLNKNRKSLSAKWHVEAAPTLTTNARPRRRWEADANIPGNFPMNSQLICEISVFDLSSVGRRGHDCVINTTTPPAFSE